MQEQQKLRKKSNKSNLIKQTRPINQDMINIQGLLKINLISLPQKKPRNIPMRSQNSREATTRKSHKSLAVNQQKLQKHTKKLEKQPKSIKNMEPAKASRTEAVKTKKKKQTAKHYQQPQRDKESSQDTREVVSHEFVQKKMNIGRKMKGNALKEFILQTLRKVKAESNFLIIHKGTAQPSSSPISKNKSKASRHQKQQFPLVLVEDRNIMERRNKQNQSIFAGNKNINRSASTKSTSINLVSSNRKFVQMARAFQGKNKKNQPNESLIEVIQQKIQAHEDQRSEQNEEIHEQIMVSNNQSIVKAEEMKR